MSFLDLYRACQYVTSPRIITLNLVAILVLSVASAVLPTSGRTSYEGAGLFGHLAGVLTTCYSAESAGTWNDAREGESGSKPVTIPRPSTQLLLGLTSASTARATPLRLRSFPFVALDL